MSESARNISATRWSLITGAGLLAAAAVGAFWLSIDLPSELNYARFKRGCGWGVAGTLPPLLLFIALRNLPSAAVRRVDKIIRQQLLPLFDGLPWYGLLWVAMLAGVSEEVFFRGVLQQAVSAFAPAWLAILAAGIVFGLAHCVTATYAFLAATMGCYFGWLFVSCDSLWAPIVAHGLYDFIVLQYLMWERANHV